MFSTETLFLPLWEAISQNDFTSLDLDIFPAKNWKSGKLKGM